tara:strand:+ start:1741 stop:3636 length:1896 start_codon:yes stop_codon:yes gene_type:complete
MKWIGQHIWDFISRFRTTVYLENLETSSEENVLVVDSDGKVTKNTTLGGADLTYNGSTANGILTYGGASVIDVESTFTYQGTSDGNHLLQSPVVSASNDLFNAYVLDVDVTYAGSHTVQAFNIDYDKSTATTGSGSVNIKGLTVDLNDAATNDAGTAHNYFGIQNSLTHANAQGTITHYGIQNTLTGGDVQYGIKNFCTGATAATTYGLHQTIVDGGYDLYFRSSADTDDYFTLQTGANGETTLTTVDGGATAAHINFVADGNMYAKIPNDTGEFSIVNTDGSGGTSHKFTSEVGAESHLYMYPSGGGVTADYLHIEVGQDGNSIIRTIHGGGTSADLELAPDGRFKVDTTDVDLYMGNHVGQDAGDVSFRSSTTMKPQLILESTANDNKPPSIKFLKDKGAAGADNDYVGTIKFSGDNTAQEETDFAHIRGRIATAGDTDEAGYLYLGVAASNGTTSSIKDAITLTGGGLDNNVSVELGYGDGDVEFKRRKFTKTGITPHFDVQGDILYLGGGSTTQGDLCYLKEDGEWGQADADGAATGDDADRDAMGMLAIALGTDPDADGMLIRGTITMDYDLGDCGNPIYVSTTAGDMTNTAPTASGDFVRVVGYCLDDTNGQIYFNPDNTWVEIA